jgi:PAS domain S-box-containing protein
MRDTPQPAARVLVVGRNSAEGVALLRSLRRSGAAHDGSEKVASIPEALERMEASPLPDVMLLGLGPDGRAAPADEAIRKLAARVAMIVVSGPTERKAMARAAQVGAQDYLVRGRFDAESMARTIRHALERKRLVDALRESEDRYRSMLELGSEGVWRFDVDPPVSVALPEREQAEALLERARLTECNDALARQYGFERADELLGMRLKQMLAGEGDDQLRSIQLFIRSGYRLVDAETSERDRFGRTVHFVSSVLGHVEGGHLRSARGLQRDVTERKQAEQDRRENQERYQRLVETAYEGILVLDTAARVTFMNPRMVEMVGYGPGEAIGRSIEEFLFEDQVPAFWAKFAKRPDREIYEWRLRRRDGGALWAVVSAAALKNASGQFVGSLAMITDITDRKRVEIELRKLSEAVAQSASSVVITDAEGNIEYVNPAFTKATGYSADEVWGKNPRVLKSGQMDPAVYRELWQRLKAGENWQGELCNRRKNGELFWETVAISPVKDAQGRITHFIASKFDVTRRRDLEMQLIQSQKMEAVGRLAGGVAHDFNNMLNVITGYSELALRKIAADAPERRHLEEILKAADRAAGLTRQLLAFSRKQVLRPLVLNLNAVASEVQKMLTRVIGEDIALVTELSPDLGNVLADRGQIEQVLMNLAVNARDAMPDGGTLTLRTSNKDVDEAESRRLPALKAGPYVLVTVTDTGTGIPEEIRTRVFEPFFTTKEAGKGTGLGLATVYGIVKQSDGFVYVDSEVGAGTTFTVYLPRVEREESRSVTARGQAVSAGGVETILVAEDDPTLREITRELLEASGYTVVTAAGGQEALSLASETPAAISLLVTDVVMSGMSGKELATQLESRFPRLRVLYVSGYTADVIGPKGLLEPGVSLLHKPFTAEALLGKVREILDRAR